MVEYGRIIVAFLPKNKKNAPKKLRYLWLRRFVNKRLPSFKNIM